MNRALILLILGVLLLLFIWCGFVFLAAFTFVICIIYAGVQASVFLYAPYSSPVKKKQLHYAGPIRIPKTLQEVYELGDEVFELFAAALAMTYYPSLKFEKHTGKSGDRGVDAYLKNQYNFRVLVQAKLYATDNHVSSKELRDFWGTLYYHNANYGFFVTTSTFTIDAQHVIQSARGRIIALDGGKIAGLLQHNQREIALHLQEIQRITEQAE